MFPNSDFKMAFGLSIIGDIAATTIAVPSFLIVAYVRQILGRSGGGGWGGGGGGGGGFLLPSSISSPEKTHHK